MTNTGRICILPSDIGFEVPDAFLVGYALDYNEYFRDLSVSLQRLIPPNQKRGNKSLLYADHSSALSIRQWTMLQLDICHYIHKFYINQTATTLSQLPKQMNWLTLFVFNYFTAHLHTKWPSQGEVQSLTWCWAGETTEINDDWDHCDEWTSLAFLRYESLFFYTRIHKMWLVGCK